MEKMETRKKIKEEIYKDYNCVERSKRSVSHRTQIRLDRGCRGLEEERSYGVQAAWVQIPSTIQFFNSLKMDFQFSTYKKQVRKAKNCGSIVERKRSRKHNGKEKMARLEHGRNQKWILKWKS